MRVNQSNSNPIQNADVGGAKQSKRTGSAQNAQKNDASQGVASSSSSGATANISARAREMARAKEVAGNAPDVREEKIAELKRRIAEGKYNVKPEAIADRMVDDHLRTGIG